ncbi:D-alanine--D-alanine ligase [Thalassotalea ponticola]|uniref:D-alanine--D-alanine ligase n=1 Tax=Thalassotalea ponticola TaxID=1523392 RepID=UPI0025B55F82|nr:D-alanine--D-alanine ligase [Thalassotalea ponticola]MDN3653566.1 D-alanine--D-alanine ligase [Thalassotalea ponticola]
MQLVDIAELKQQHIAVLYGGQSAEREVSLASGAAVVAGLSAAGFKVTGIDTKHVALAQLVDMGIERVFIALHGRGGEDGCIQGALEYLGLPYTGSGVLGSALSMDKVRTKQIFAANALPTADFVVVNKEHHHDIDCAEILARLGNKVMVKPAKEGSSIGMSIARDAEQLARALATAFDYDQQVLVEAWLSGAEFTVAVLGDETLPPISMVTNNEFYDYQAKYQSKTTQYLCPCGLDSVKEHELRQLALNAFRATGAQGWGRVDVMQDSHGNFNLLEVNTVPGMTETSLVPKAAKVAGLDFQQLVTRILQMSEINK